LVGGQAVNIWSQISLNSDEQAANELEQFLPFTSKDCDLLGDRDLLHRLAQKTRLKIQQFPFGQPTCCIGMLYDPADPDKEPVIEVLDRVRGLELKELKDPVTIELVQGKVRTLNPIRLLKAKLANVAEIPQGDRQDVRHVRMLIPSVRVYLMMLHGTACADSEQVLTLKKALKVTLVIIQSDHARRAAREHGIGFMGCLPLGALKESPLEAARKFAEHQLPRIENHS